MPRNRSWDAKRKDATLRHAMALKMRLEGQSVDQIAAATGWTLRTTRDFLAASLRKVILEDAEEIKKMEDRRLDELFNAHYPLALAGEVKSTELCLKIMERRADLRGLDAPKRVETKGEETKRLEIVQIHMPMAIEATVAAGLISDGGVVEGELVDAKEGAG